MIIFEMAFYKERKFQIEEDDLVIAHREIKRLREELKLKDNKIESLEIVNHQIKNYMKYVEELKLLAEDRVRTMKMILMKLKYTEEDCKRILCEDDNEKQAVFEDFSLNAD